MKYYQVLISAEDKEQAFKILDALLEKKLVLGGPFIQGPAKFWWKSEVVKMDYGYIVTYTREDLRNGVTKVVEKASEEEVPMISFLPFEGNKKLIMLLEDTLK